MSHPVHPTAPNGASHVRRLPLWLAALLCLCLLGCSSSGSTPPPKDTIGRDSIPPLATTVGIPSPTLAALAQVTPTLTSPPATHTPTATATPTMPPTATPTASRAPVTYAPTVPPAPTVINAGTPIPIEPSPTPLPTPAGVISYTVKVPILMYHYVSTPPPDADDIRVSLSVEPAQFRLQMQYLADNGFTPIDFYQLSRAIAGHEELPLKPVIITLDDGHLDAYTNAFPILKEFGFTATFFVITEFVDFNYAPYVTWDMVIEMAEAGMRIEPHTKTAPGYARPWLRLPYLRALRLAAISRSTCRLSSPLFCLSGWALRSGRHRHARTA